jgi:hypothetical protein
LTSPEWPPLPYSDWEATCDTLHLWTQIVGKTRMALTPPMNHWWHVPLYVTPRGLNTSSIPCGTSTFEVEFDFLAHYVAVRTSTGAEHRIPLYPRSVADFYAEYMDCLRSLGIHVTIDRVPVEFDDATPFDQDQHHASYDKPPVENFHRILLGSDRIFKRFRSRFLGKCSPVHFFWGSFDLAVTRFSGRLAPRREGADRVTVEAYSHEAISCGFWPGDRRFEHAAFYSYTAPAPPGLDQQAVRPAPACWNPQLGEFLLKYDDMRASASPADALLDFCQTTYEAGATLAAWDRKALERDRLTGRPVV